MKKINTLCVVAVASIFAGDPSHSQAANTEISSSLALELIALERTVGNATERDRNMLLAVLTDMIQELEEVEHPQTAEEAVSATEKIATVMARRNFLQPIDESNWPDTLAVAFRPVEVTPDRLSTLFSYAGNRARSKYIAKDKPIYYVDCDMGALLLLSAIQHMGWDARLVTVTKHAFIRWHLPGGSTVNWDWTYWASNSDASYMSPDGLSGDLIRRGTYLKSLDRSAARGHYLGLMAKEARDHQDALALGEKAIRADPNSPLTLNNFAWDLAIDPNGSSASRARGVYFALLGWAANVELGNRADTVACALAAKGDPELALAMADYAIKNAESVSSRSNYQESKERIERGELCE